MNAKPAWDKSQIEAIKAVIMVLKIKYTLSEVPEEKSPYDAKFVAMIKQGEIELRSGHGVKMSLDGLEKLCR